MAIDKLIPQYLSSDTDQKLVKSVEMIDNLNIRVSNNDEGTSGVLKNIKGTEAVTAFSPLHALPDGENRVIGSVDNSKSNEVLFFLWNSNGDHGIYRIDSIYNTFKKVYQDSVLGFTKLAFVDSDIIINEAEETLLYWTDNVNPPMKINVNRALNNDYPASLTSGTDEEKLLNLTIAKPRPDKAPSYSVVNNPSVTRNNIREKHFQFAYRYKYEDGEISALSEWSSFSFASTQTKSDFIEIDSKDFYNQINVFVRHSVAEVKKIIVYARELGSETFYEIEEIDNNYTSNAETIEFTNNKLGTALSDVETNKSYDNVPQKAKALAIAGNRLMMANYEEGYENTDISVEVNNVYREKEEAYTLRAYVQDGSYSYYQQKVADATNEYEIKFDYSSLPSTLPAGSVVNIEFVLVSKIVEVFADPNNEHYQMIFSWKIDKDLISNKLSDSMVFTTGIKQTGTSESWKLPVKNVVFKESFRTTSVKSKSDIVSDINSLLTSNTFNGIVDSDRYDEDNANVYETVSGIFPNAFAKAKVWLQGTASFALEEGVLANNIQTFNLKFAGASVSVRDAEILDFDYLPTALTSYPVAVEVVSAPVQKIGGQAGFSINPLIYPNTISVEYVDSGIAGTSSFVAENLDGYSSFKSDANHLFGLVYFDDRGRASGVNKINSVYVEGYENRLKKGGSLIDFRISNNPPSWAKKYQLVYAGNENVEKFIQYSVGSPLIPKDKDEYVSDAVYVSMSVLEGSKNSYAEKSGALIEYKYTEGDILKIIRYTNHLGNKVYPTGYEFKVIGYERVNDASERFLAPKGRDWETKNGWVLKLEKVNKAGFSFNEVRSGDSLWDRDVVVEILTPKKEVKNRVYYGVGKSYDIVSGLHQGDRDVTTQASATLTIDGVGGITSSDRLYVGDTINVNGVVITIDSVSVELDGTYSYTYRGVVSAQATASYQVGNYQSAVITANRGDVFFRPRKLIRRNDTIKNNVLLLEQWDESSFNVDVEFIEDYAISDFYKSDGFTRNKPYAFIPDSRTIRRKASITYSDAFVIDSDRLNLSSFNLSLANWSDVDIIYGGIYSIVSRGDALTVIQETKTLQIPINKNVVEYADGSTSLAVSKNVLGTPSYYAGDYGTSNPESVVERFGVLYFCDINSRKVIRISADGITPISEKGMDSFFQNLFTDLQANVAIPKIVGGFDPDNNEYMITVEDFSASTITIQSSDPELEPTVYEIEVNEDSEYEPTPIYTSTQIVWNTIPLNWNSICQDWNDVGNGYLELDGVFYLDSAFQGSTGVVTILVTDAANSFVAVAQYNLGTGVVTMPSQTCGGRNISTKFGGAESSGGTISYKHSDGVWSSKYSFLPSNYASIGNYMYSFYHNDNGLVWRHNANDVRCLIYGVQEKSMFEVVSNFNPSMIKSYQALAVEGGGNWTAKIKNATQETFVSEFDEREGHRYAMIPRDTAGSKGHQILIGTVASISNNDITFTTPINRLPFVVGDQLRVGNGTNLNTTGVSILSVIDRRTLRCSGNNVSVGDKVFVEHNSIVDGDVIRDVYASIKLESTDSEPFEVHAVSVHFDRSRLHNDRVN